VVYIGPSSCRHVAASIVILILGLVLSLNAFGLDGNAAWAGTWEGRVVPQNPDESTEPFDMTITFRVSGNQLSGSFTGERASGSVTGRIEGQASHGEWSAAGANGTFQLILNGQANTFTGDWQGRGGGLVNATKVSEPNPPQVQITPLGGSPVVSSASLPPCTAFHMEVVYGPDFRPATDSVEFGVEGLGERVTIPLARVKPDAHHYRSKVLGNDFWWQYLADLPNLPEPPPNPNLPETSWEDLKAWSLTNLDSVTSGLRAKINTLQVERAGITNRGERFWRSTHIAVLLHQLRVLANDDAVLKSGEYMFLTETQPKKPGHALANNLRFARDENNNAIALLEDTDREMANEHILWARDAWGEYFSPENFQEVINESHWTGLKFIGWGYHVLFHYVSGRGVIRIIPPPPPEIRLGPGLREYPEFPSSLARYLCIPVLTLETIDLADLNIVIPVVAIPLEGIPEIYHPLVKLMEEVFRVEEYRQLFLQKGIPDLEQAWKLLYEDQERLNRLLDLLGVKREELFPSRESMDYDSVRERGYQDGLNPTTSEGRLATTRDYRERHGIPSSRLSNSDIDHNVPVQLGDAFFPPEQNGGQHWNPNFDGNLMPLSSPVNRGSKQQWEKTIRDIIEIEREQPGGISEERLRELFDTYVDKVYEDFSARGGGRVLPRVVPESKLKGGLKERFEQLFRDLEDIGNQ
jgi:hypothetical protein